MLGGLLISGEKVDQTIKTLSGGERAKVALTKMLLTKPHVIIMDEPSSPLEELEVRKLYEVIARLKAANCGIIYVSHKMREIAELGDRVTVFKGTSLIVSHDRDLLEHISNKVWLIAG